MYRVINEIMVKFLEIFWVFLLNKKKKVVHPHYIKGNIRCHVKLVDSVN